MKHLTFIIALLASILLSTSCTQQQTDSAGTEIKDRLALKELVDTFPSLPTKRRSPHKPPSSPPMPWWIPIVAANGCRA